MKVWITTNPLHFVLRTLEENCKKQSSPAPSPPRLRGLEVMMGIKRGGGKEAWCGRGPWRDVEREEEHASSLRRSRRPPRPPSLLHRRREPPPLPSSQPPPPTVTAAATPSLKDQDKDQMIMSSLNYCTVNCDNLPLSMTSTIAELNHHSLTFRF
jgi:hypothetical protein